MHLQCRFEWDKLICTTEKSQCRDVLQGLESEEVQNDVKLILADAVMQETVQLKAQQKLVDILLL